MGILRPKACGFQEYRVTLHCLKTRDDIESIVRCRELRDEVEVKEIATV